jgi:hypothetical protein
LNLTFDPKMAFDVNLGSGSGGPTEGEEAPTRLVFYSRKYGFKVYEQKRAWFLEGKRGRGALHSNPQDIVDVVEVVHGKRIAKRLARKLGVEWVDDDV